MQTWHVLVINCWAVLRTVERIMTHTMSESNGLIRIYSLIFHISAQFQDRPLRDIVVTCVGYDFLHFLVIVCRPSFLPF
jgi:hypothetical protein